MVTLAVGTMLSAPASATLITNGGFETGNTSGWTVTGDVDVVSSATWTPSQGNYSLDLNGFNTGAISQVISTVAGQSYLLQFDLSGNFSTTTTTKTVTVDAGSSSVVYDVPYSSSWSKTNLHWATTQQYFIASGATTTVSFNSGNTGAEGVTLDNIQAVAAPEPGTFALLGLGLVGLGLRRRARARS